MRADRRHPWKFFLLLLWLFSLEPELPSPAFAQAIVHTVQPGENLYRIALRYGVTVDALVTANNLPDAAHIYAGQHLIIPTPSSAPAGPPSVHIVRSGENLYRIALRYHLPVSALAAANGIANPNRIYAGQRLQIPSRSAVPSSAADIAYVVRPGDTLAGIALRYNVSAWALARLNHLRNPSLIYAGQILHIPAADRAPWTPVTMPVTPPTAGRWIDVDLTAQRVTAYVGHTPVRTTPASTGLPGTPTVTGRYRIYAKYLSTLMSGPGYYLPNVPYTMYFYRGYGLHGTYWHSNFGHPMSHGCVNLPTPEARWLYNWAPLGTLVNIHY